MSLYFSKLLALSITFYAISIGGVERIKNVYNPLITQGSRLID